MKKTFILRPSRFIVLAVFFLTACAPAYVPNTLNTPMLSNKKELQIAAGTGTSIFDPQVAYALTNHIGLMLNGSFGKRTLDSGLYHRHSFIEGGAGYYLEFVPDWKFEIYGGYGIGRMVGSYLDIFTTDYVHEELSPVSRVFLQPGVSYSADDFEISIALRNSYLTVHQGTSVNSHLFVEPALTLKYSVLEHLNIFVQGGLSIPTDDEYDFTSKLVMLSFGLRANFNRNVKNNALE